MPAMQRAQKTSCVGDDRALAEVNTEPVHLYQGCCPVSEQAGRLQFELDIAAEIAETRQLENAAEETKR